MAAIIQKNIDLQDSKVAETQVILDYWNDRRGSRLAPPWSDIELIDLPLSIIPHIVVVDIIPEPLDFRYRFWGTWHSRFHGYDQTNKLVSGLHPPSYQELLTQQYEQTAAGREPQLFVQQIPIKNEIWAYTELCRFPLSNDGKTITNILSTEFLLADINDVREYFC